MADGFDASLIYRGLAGAGDNVADLIKKRKHEEEQNAFNQTAFQTLSTAQTPDGQPLLTEEEKQRFTSGNLNQKNGIIAAGGARLLNVFQTAKEKQAMELAKIHQQLMGVQTQVAQKDLQDNPYAQQPVYDQSGNQVGVYDDKGTPHYFPYGGYGGGKQPFTPDEQTQKHFRDLGYEWQQKSPFSGIYVHTKADQPDLDEQGNPKFTPDGTAFISHGKVTPLTDTMKAARQAYLQQQADKSAPPSMLNPLNWFRGGTQPSPTPSPQPSPSAPQAASGAAPVTPALSPQDQQALAWAQANPSDPRAAAILKKLGVQ